MEDPRPYCKCNATFNTNGMANARCGPGSVFSQALNITSKKNTWTKQSSPTWKKRRILIFIFTIEEWKIGIRIYNRIRKTICQDKSSIEVTATKIVICSVLSQTSGIGNIYPARESSLSKSMCNSVDYLLDHINVQVLTTVKVAHFKSCIDNGHHLLS